MRRRITGSFALYHATPWYTKMVTAIVGAAGLGWVISKIERHTGPLDLWDVVFYLPAFLFFAGLLFPRHAKNVIGWSVGLLVRKGGRA